jgi:L-alanine-DL-glutamate epimerase-like enolase superfamily enzyme
MTAMIERVELHCLRVPLTTPYKLAFGALTHFDTILAEVHERAGGYGIGEATIVTGYTDETIAGAWQLVTALAPQLPGLSVPAAQALLEPHGSRNPFAVTALCTAIEMAAGAPLLTVSERVRVPMLGLVNAMEEARYGPEIEALLAAGYRTLKVKVGFDAAADARRVRAIQRLVGTRARIRLDANQGYGREEACRFAAALEPEGIELFEQPCAAADWDAAVAVARVATVPMMLDESIYGLDDIERAAASGAARYVKLKLMKLGSLARLAQGLRLIRRLGMQPVLGNGVACDPGCWMEACVARGLIDNAGEMNGFLKPRTPLVARALAVEAGALVLEPGFAPVLERECLARVRVAHVVCP